MSITRNRELSQFGSFIYIDDSTQNIGITSGSTPSVGIGTTNPSVKFEVIGDTNIVGTIEASSYTLNGTPLVDATLAQWNFGTNIDDVYRLIGNVGIGTSIFTQKLTVVGNISAGQFISTVTSGTAPFVVLSDTQVTNLNASFLRGKIPPSGTIVGTTDTQTLTNKTLTSPTLTTPIISSIVNTGTITLPTSTTTLVGRNTTDTLTNKTIAAGSNTITGLTNSNLSGSAGITNANLANSTISGISLGSNLNSLSFGSYLSSGGSYDGSTSRTVSVAGTSINTGNTLVARDVSGDFTAGTVNVTNLNASQTIIAQDFDSISDNKVKENVQTVENALEIINALRGVSFDWKETGNKSYGVIAQEIAKILPALVKDGEIKSVNYNGLIGILIEAVKELSAEIESLKRKSSFFIDV
jgi:hypothetical protein